MTRPASLTHLYSECVLFLLLCTIFAVDIQAREGVVTGKVCWFNAVVPVCLALTCLAWMTSHPRAARLRWHPADGILAALTVLTVLVYRWPLHPEPVRLQFFAQWLLCWTGLRILTCCAVGFERQAASLLTFVGGIEAWLSLLQCYGILPSLHGLFPMTGTFYNPGPLGGCLAMILPVAWSDWVRRRRAGCMQPERSRKKGRATRRMQWICMAGMAVALPASMSRSAWLAAAAGCGLTVWGVSPGLRQRVNKQLRGWLHRDATIRTVCATVAGLLAAAVGLYAMRPESVTGRLLVWRVTCHVMAHHPAGVGPGGFPAAFADAQARMLAGDGVTAAEKDVADCPENAFNEYLQCGAELGWAGLLLMLAGLLTVLRTGWCRGRYGWAGAWVALCVFAFSSYPLQLPSFWVLLAVTGSQAVAPSVRRAPPAKASQGLPSPTRSRRMQSVGIGLLLLTVLSGTLTRTQPAWRKACRTWQFVSSLQHTSDSTAIELYNSLLPSLHHNPELLLEYALCLNRTGQYAAADSLLGRAAQLSADPVIWAVRGRNAQAMQQFPAAEQYLLHAATVVPSRMYPHYLLVNLYADSLWAQPEKLQREASIVLGMHPRIQSPATDEMQAAVRALLEEPKVYPNDDTAGELEGERPLNETP